MSRLEAAGPLFLFNDDEIPAEQVTQPLSLFAPAPLQLFPRLRHGVYELSFLLQAFGVKLDAATFVEPHRLTISLALGFRGIVSGS